MNTLISFIETVWATETSSMLYERQSGARNLTQARQRTSTKGAESDAVKKSLTPWSMCAAEPGTFKHGSLCETRL